MAKRMLSEAEGYELFQKYGVPTPAFQIVTGADEAAEAASEIGYPVVMKIISPQIVHKSDAGGVVVGISGPEEAKKAFDRIVSSAK